MNKPVKIFIMLVIVLIAALSLVSCTEKEEQSAGKITVPVGTADDFYNIKNTLGEKYAEATFELTNDIEIYSSDWQPVGSDIKNSFRSRFNGNGHTITIYVDDNGSYKSFNGGNFGLFGCIYGAEFENLTVNVDYCIETVEDYSFIGALAGFAYGENTFKNITLNGSIDIVPEQEREYVEKNDIYRRLIDKTAYIGGLFGYGTGVFNIENVHSSLQIEAPLTYDYEVTPSEFYFHSLYVGSVAGYLRTINISASNTERNTISGIVAEPRINVTSGNLYAGGAAGIVYNTDITNVDIDGNGNIVLNAYNHAYAGGAFGHLDNVAVTDTVIDLDMDVKPISGGGRGNAYSVGGAFGYLSNGSVADGVTITSVMNVTIGLRAETFCGGAAGTVNNSTLKNARIHGKYSVMDTADTPEDLFNIITGGEQVNVKDLAGIAGLLVGEAKLDDVISDFVCYQGAVSFIINNVTIEREKDENGKDKVVKVETPEKVDLINVYFAQENTGAYYYSQNGDISNDNFMPNGRGQATIGD